MGKKTESAENLPAVVDANSFPVLYKEGFGEVVEVLQGILDTGESLSMRNLTRVKVPGAGGTVWKFPTEDGHKNVEEFEGVIVGIIPSRAYWKESGAASVPPDCSSTDMEYGNGPEMGRTKCADCQFNQFGSANDGKNKGKACREVRNLLVLTKGMTMPTLLIAPPTSIKPLGQYRMTLLSNQPIRPLHGVVTKFSLKEITGGANPYSEIVFKLAAPLEGEQIAMAKQYATMIDQLFRQGVSHEAPDFEG